MFWNNVVCFWINGNINMQKYFCFQKDKTLLLQSTEVRLIFNKTNIELKN